jgi:threonine aldolase
MTALHPRGFASDNYSGIHPAVLAAITAANVDHVTSYGADPITGRLQDRFKALFGPQAEAFPVFNGTGANVVGLQALTRRWGSVICTSSAHVHVDECGAPEKVAGIKLLPVPTSDGKLTPELIDREAWGFDDEHRAQPQVVLITQSTELGTLYTVEEVAAICDHAHSLGMSVLMDGARIANAAAALDVPVARFTTDAGVDMLSFGGTKNGMMIGEAVVVLSPERASGLLYLRKCSMQLASKMRFISAQFEALLTDDLWLRNARHSNAMARRLEAAVSGIDGVKVTRAAQANAVFAILDADVITSLQQQFKFYVWDQSINEVRWMCSFDTTEDDVDAFAAAVKAATMSR